MLGKGSKKQSSASYVKNGKHAWRTFLFENYERNFRQTKEVSTVRLGNMHHIGITTWSCMFGCVLWGGTDRQLRRIQCSVLESTYRMPLELDPSLIPACMLPYDNTNSYRVSYNFQDVDPCWGGGSFYIGMPLWYVVHPATYLDLVSCVYLQDTKIQYNCLS